MDINIDIVFRIAAIGILIAVLSQLLIKAGRDDIALMVSVTGLILVLLMVVQMVSDLFTNIKNIFGL